MRYGMFEVFMFDKGCESDLVPNKAWVFVLSPSIIMLY